MKKWLKRGFYGIAGLAVLCATALAAPAFALDKADLELVFEDDFESGLKRWTLYDPENWRIEEEGETGNHVLSLFAPSGHERPYFAPRSVAMAEGLMAGSFIFEARLHHRGQEYGHQDLCVLFNFEGEYQGYYAHFAPVADEGANTIFLLDNADRTSIATERSDGSKWGETWHDVRIERDADAGTIAVYFDDLEHPCMRAEDTTFGEGLIGLGSYNDIGWFDDVKIWATPPAEGSGWVSLFDGETLNGWQAPDMRYWSVEEGAITASSSDAVPCETNQYLVWQGGDVADFELKAQFRLENNQGNSGIQFRSRIRESDGMGIGYQADILPGGPWCGALADEYTTREPLMVPNGHHTTVDPDGTRTCTPLDSGPVSLRPPGQWNDYHIRAQGHEITLTINGQTSAEFTDNDTQEFDPAGILALQLRSGPPMKVQFKELWLKALE